MIVKRLTVTSQHNPSKFCMKAFSTFEYTLYVLKTSMFVTEMQREKEKSKNFMACWLHKKGIIKHLKGLKRITTHSRDLIISWICIHSS